jgi:hypothetical protein
MRSLSHQAGRGVVCCLLGPLFAGAQEGSPAAVLPEIHCRFGTATEGEPVRHDFLLCSRGSTDLGIEK